MSPCKSKKYVYKIYNKNTTRELKQNLSHDLVVRVVRLVVAQTPVLGLQPCA